MLTTINKLRILDFDIENRPLTYWIPDQPTAEITAIASAWVDEEDSLIAYLLGEDDPIDMLNAFVDRYNEADMVTGHYIRKHDLPIINGALMEYGLPKLEPKLTCDTRLDLTKKLGLPATQEYLCKILGVPVDKEHMTQDDWRMANRLTPEGIDRTYNRVSSDVEQHMLLRLELVKRKLLKPPRVWSPY